MIKNFYPPKKGDSILLICTECKRIFTGPKPDTGILKIFSKTKCPACGSHKVVQYPFIFY